MANKLLAFKGKDSIKEKYVKRVEAHAAADEIVQGKYWEDGKGCAVGCTIEGSDHGKYETQLGIPKEIAYLEDVIFEGLTNGEAKEFPSRFLRAIKPGADLSKVGAKFMIWQFEDKKYGLSNIKEVKKDKEIYGFCEEVVSLYKRVEVGDDPTEDEFYQLFLRIDRSEAGAWAWAGAGAWAWARASYDIGHAYPNGPVPELDPKDERLLFLADKNGYLTGRNSFLENERFELQDKIRRLEKSLEDLRSTTAQLTKDRDQYRDDYWEYKREAENLRQYKPKEEKKDGEEGKDQTEEN